MTLYSINPLFMTIVPAQWSEVKKILSEQIDLVSYFLEPSTRDNHLTSVWLIVASSRTP